jgi:hypothetical protein
MSERFEVKEGKNTKTEEVLFVVFDNKPEERQLLSNDLFQKYFGTTNLKPSDPIISAHKEKEIAERKVEWLNLVQFWA